jgi:catechol 2,3-dioxygenase-like lactoylglutathione lyase family enzyme
VWVNAVDRPKAVKNRLHLDVYAASIADLEALGATVLARAEDTGLGWTVMADPEGGEFCAFLREPAKPADDGGLPAYRLHGIGIDCVDPAAAAAWWGRVFGVTPTTYEGHDWHTLEHATPDPVLTLDFAPVPEPRQGPNRVHWDVVGDADALLAAGATHLWDMPHWTVLADPEGNEFCVFPDPSA